MKKSWRLMVVWCVLGVAVLGLLWRLIDLSVIERSFLLQQSQARILRKITIPAYRGIVTDRLGSPLAVSTPALSVWVNPLIFTANTQQIHALARALHMSPKAIRRAVKKKPGREFVYLRRAVLPAVSHQIKTLNIQGVFFQREYRRYYPEGEITAHVVGFTNIDDRGQEGLELAFDQWLHGHSGQKEVLKDRLGHIITELAMIRQPMQGKNLALSIDHRIQYLAYKNLKEAVAQYHATSGSVVVLDVATGEILAMANQPVYDPNRRHGQHAGIYRNRAVTDVFEPGSVIKAFTVALALESGRYQPNTKIDTHHGWMKIGGYRIHDDLDYGVVTLTQLLQKSSNIAAAKILLSMNAKQYGELLAMMGFGESTNSGFPGEASGRIPPQETWVPSMIATLAYGYGLSVTPLQLAQAYSAIASGGIKRPVTFLRVSHPVVAGHRVLPATVALQLIQMLKTVVEEGTGTRAQVPGYQIAGKTGTAYIANAHGYDHRRYMSSFVGFAPASHPRIVVAVVIKEPKTRHFGSDVAAPIFSKVMSGALRLLDVAPDENF